MAKRRISMRKIREVLRLKWQHELSNRKIAHSCSISHSTVREYKIKLKASGYRLVYEVVEEEVYVLVIAVGKRDKNLVYKKAMKKKRNG